MSDIIKSEAGGVVSLLHGGGTGISIGKPFERDIFLFNTFVAGTTHIYDIELIAPYINIDDRLQFFREPDNPHDDKAISVKTMDDKKIGYVPRYDNVIFSRLMDAGKYLFGKVTEKELIDGWHKISIGIYLHE